ncbi:MAG: hypothetical protein Q6K99_05225 [Thermostichales cyanobacterium BF4_bins_65]
MSAAVLGKSLVGATLLGLLSAPGVWAQRLQGVELTPVQGRLRVQLRWEGENPPPYQSRFSEQGLTLIFPTAELTGNPELLRPQSFPELGISSLVIQPGEQGIHLHVAGEGLQAETSSTSIEIWSQTPPSQFPAPLPPIAPAAPSPGTEVLPLAGGGQVRITRPTTVPPVTPGSGTATGPTLILPLAGGGQVEITRPGNLALSESGSLVLPLEGGGQLEVRMPPAQAPLAPISPQAVSPLPSPPNLPAPVSPAPVSPPPTPPQRDPQPVGQVPLEPPPPVILTPGLEQTQPGLVPDGPPPVSSRAADLDLTQQLVAPQPFLGQLPADQIVEPLVLQPSAPFPALPELTPDNTAFRPSGLKLSPLQRPPYRLFGFETASTLENQELVISAGGTSFNNPLDFRIQLAGATSQRGNDIRFSADYGITDNLQVSIGAVGKDDTIFTNPIRVPIPNQDTAVQFLYGGIPLQAKWQFYEDERLSAALVLGAEVAAETFKPTASAQALITTEAARKVIFAVGSLRTADGDILVAEDNSTFYSIALPITYKVSDQLRLHLNPQISYFPQDLPVTNALGDLNNLLAANIGYTIDRLRYYGTVTSVGLGLDYRVNEYIQFMADTTLVLSGLNSVAGQAEGSLFTTRNVYNIGFRVAPNSRFGLNLYLTNRFGPVSFGPASVLVQPGGDTGIALDVMYLPDWGQGYEIVRRTSYPPPREFLRQPGGFPSTTLPLGSVVYELAFGSRDSQQLARFGVLDDLEFVVGYSSTDTDGNYNLLPTELSFFTRLAVLPDRGQRGLTAAWTLGLTGFAPPDGSVALGLYSDLPLTFRDPQGGIQYSLTPKFVIPQEAAGIGTIIGLTLGVRGDVGENTQIYGSFTPILSGQNQLNATTRRLVPGAAATSFIGTTALYSLGIRQLFPAGNSLYAADLFWTNAVGDYGLRGLAAQADGGSRVGIRFSVLNGIPGGQP